MEPNYFAYFLDEAVDLLSGWEKSCLQLEQSNDREAAESLYRTAHNLKSGSAAVGLAAFRNFVHMVEELISKYLAGQITISSDLIRSFLEVHTVLTGWIGKLRNDPGYVPEQELSRVSAQIGGATATPKETSKDALEIVKPAPTVEEPKNVAGTPAPARASETLRVAASKLDMLIHLAGELSTQQAIVWHARQNNALQSKSCDNAIQLIQKNAKDLQSLALSLRMQPLQSLFQRLERAARDLARAQNKKIDVVIHGGDVELDRAVIDRIADALMHVIRNAIDHGIEEPAVREQQNKPPTATLRLEGGQEPGGISIGISEDGKGLDGERILKKAIEKGLANPEQKYTNAEIQRFIFAHGFSTAEKVTDVSGRGVGMDVVKKATEDIGGSIIVSSVVKKGTKFTITLPTTLSIIDALIVDVEGGRYAVPIQDVAEIVDLSGIKLETASSKNQLLTLRDMLVPVEFLKAHLPTNPITSIEGRSNFAHKKDSLQPALLVYAGENLMAFRVDDIIGQQPVSMRPLPISLDGVTGYTGGAILGDGDPCVILSLPAMVRRHIEKIGSKEESNNDASAAEGPASFQQSSMHDQADQRLLIFKLKNQMLATPLLPIREIVPLMACQKIMAMPDNILGCVDLRGEILPVINLAFLLNLSAEESRGPMIVVEISGCRWVFAVDHVEAVADLTLTAGGVCRFREQLVSLIDLEKLLAELDQSFLTVPISNQAGHTYKEAL